MKHQMLALMRPGLALVALLTLTSQPADAQLPPAAGPSRIEQRLPDPDPPAGTPMSLEEFRQVLADIGYFADGVRAIEAAAHGTSISGEDLQARLAAFTDEQLQPLLEALPDAWKLQAAARRLREQIDTAPGLQPDWDPPRPQGLVLNPQTPYAPGYGNMVSGPYSLYTATLPGLGYITDTDGDGALNDERCNDKVADAIIAAEALEIFAITMHSICEGSDVVIAGFTTPAAAIACGTALAAELAEAGARVAIEQCAFHDGWIDGSEIQAAWANTQKLLDQVQCVPAAVPRRGGACNGVDDDCDQVIDECDEDGFAPDVSIDGTVSARWFRSVGEATAAVVAATRATDDCQVLTLDPPDLSGTCGTMLATVTATDGCGLSAQASATVQVDGTAPSVVIDPAVVTSCYPTVAAAEAAVLAAATIGDDCTPLPKLATRVDSTVTGCSLRVRIEVTDLAGNLSSATTTVRVDPNPPAIHIDAAVSIPWYANTAEATAAVALAVFATDDCGDVTLSPPSLSGSCGNVTATVTATDGCGLTTEASAIVKVDGSLPSVSIDPSVETACFPTVAAAEAAVRSAATISDDCTPLSKLDIRLDSTVSECNLRVRIEVIDLAGHRAMAAVTVKVDPKPPVVHIDDAVSIPWYADAAEAAAAVARAVSATDDCGPVTVTAPALLGACGAVTATVTARDACGNATVASTIVKIDGTAPVVTIPAAATNMCFSDISGAETTVLGMSSISDDCTPIGRLNVKVTSTVTECQLRIQIEAIDQAGHRTVSAVTVVADTSRPDVEIQRLLLGFRSEVLGFMTPPCFASVLEAEEAVLAATRAHDSCTATDQIALSVTSSGPDCARLVTVMGNDRCGNLSTDAVTVRIDANAPLVTTSVTKDVLWPPNHEMVDVGFAYTATDDCGGGLDVEIRVTSDEHTASADGAGQTTPAPDAEILRRLDGSIAGIRVRAERSESGDGRVYGIHVTATDACGNSTTSSSEVSVPPNRPRPAVDSGQYYDATAVN